MLIVSAFSRPRPSNSSLEIAIRSFYGFFHILCLTPTSIHDFPVSPRSPVLEPSSTDFKPLAVSVSHYLFFVTQSNLLIRLEIPISPFDPLVPIARHRSEILCISSASNSFLTSDSQGLVLRWTIEGIPTQLFSVPRSSWLPFLSRYVSIISVCSGPDAVFAFSSAGILYRFANELTSQEIGLP
jgi:hypothetical protein